MARFVGGVDEGDGSGGGEEQQLYRLQFSSRTAGSDRIVVVLRFSEPLRLQLSSCRVLSLPLRRNHGGVSCANSCRKEKKTLSDTSVCYSALATGNILPSNLHAQTPKNIVR